MPRSPLFQALRRAVRLAIVANRHGSPPADELSGLLAEQRLSRRRFLQVSGAMAVAAGAGSLLSSCGGRPTLPRLNRRRLGESPRIAIVGAGLAGLAAAFHLEQGGLRADIYEASTRVGGRIYTAQNLLGPSLATELGGEFIDSTHKDLLGLASHFNLLLNDMEEDPVEREESFFFAGRHYTEADLVAELRPIVALLAQDLDSIGDYQNYHRPARAASIDRLSIVEYLDQLLVSGWSRTLLETAYRAEYGREPEEQSALNLLFMISTDIDSFSLFGESDERFRMQGGNQRLPDALSGLLGARVQRPYILEAITERASGDYTLTFQRPGAISQDIVAQAVVLALPFTLLRDVEFRDIDMPRVKRRAINELGYGTNAKVLFGMKSRPWREEGHSGTVYSDLPFQVMWDNSRMQAGPHGGLTAYLGGQAGEHLDRLQDPLPDHFLPGMNGIFPGIGDAFSGVAEKFHWPSHPFTRGSYSCYLPGQWTSISGAEAEPVGNIFFAGEHCSQEFQGFMNGAAESGRLAAEAIFSRIGART